MEKNSKIYIAGHEGLVGSAIMRNLKSKGFINIIGRTHSELDLTNQRSVEEFFNNEKPEYVFLAAAKVGGIHANNTYPADFIMSNIQIQCNVIESAFKIKLKKLLFLGSSCIYPKMCPQPMKEEYLLSGYLEPTNEAYAIAKIAGIKICEYYNKQYGTKYISVMPTNLYGPNDNFNLENSHVLPALIRKIHEAKIENKEKVDIWGTGKPLREFLYVDDMSDACVYLMETYEGNNFVNVGTGKDLTINELAEMIKEIVGFSGELVYNTSKPDGTPKKLLDVSRLESLGWKYKIELYDGIRETYHWFLKSVEDNIIKR
jgi:GDP-L-fucose synthase